MGGSNSTHRVSFDSDESENVTVVKGVRLSENVINRMRESSKPPIRSSEPVAPSPPPSGLAADLVTTPTEPAATAASPSPSLPPPALQEPVTPPATVDDSELRRKISEEVQKGLEEERSRTQYELHRWLEKERARVKAQARSDAQAHIQDEVNRILASERAAALDGVQKAALRESASAEEERRRTKRLAKQLEERDQQLKKQDAFYREQLNKLEERSTQFYKITNENYRKAADEVKAKFRRYEISPVCADLQGQILTCYRENAGKTLLCSNIASLYMECVNNATQNKVRTGG